MLKTQGSTSRLFGFGYQQWVRDIELGIQNLMLHGLRSLLTMLGMIFGVAAVVAMLSIGAGARQKVMALIEQMGVRNLIVEAKETTEWQAHQKMRKISPGLTLEDYRVILDDVDGIQASTPRKRVTPSKTIPKSQQDVPGRLRSGTAVPANCGPSPVERQVLRSSGRRSRCFRLRLGHRRQVQPVWSGRSDRSIRKGE